MICSIKISNNSIGISRNLKEAGVMVIGQFSGKDRPFYFYYS